MEAARELGGACTEPPSPRKRGEKGENSAATVGSPAMAGSILGAAVKRVEDPRFITGRGTYLANKTIDGALWMAVVRSPVAHGRITDIDVSGATGAPGVVGVYTAADLDLPPLAPGAPGADPATARPILAVDVVRFVGEPVAVVVAEDPVAAVDAAGEVWVDIDPLPAVATVDAALADGAPLLFPELGTNVVLTGGHTADHDVLADADVVVRGVFENQRLAPVPMEPNSAAAIPDGDRLEVWVGSQNVFIHQVVMANVLGIERNRLHVIVPDMGGGFGAKVQPYPEQILTAALALKLGRPVRWQETRTENLLAMTHGRDQRQEVELGARRDGTVVGLRARLTQNAGAYTHFGAFLAFFTDLMAAGPYMIPEVDVSWRSVVTNTTPVHAYRGAGRPEATAMLERAMDLLASELGVDPAEVRRRNFIPPDRFPYTTPTGARYDTGDYAAALDRALEVAGYAELRAEQARRRERGDRIQLGIGLSSYVEITAPAERNEWSSAEVHDDGSVTVTVGTSSHGQGHETAFAQIVSELLNVPMERITVVQGDSDLVARGGGTMGSRSLQLGGVAVLEASEEVLEKARRIVAHALEAAVDDVVLFDDGRLGIAGVPDTALTWGEVAALAADADNLPEGVEPGLSAATTIEQQEATFPFGTHVSVAEVDTVTGDVRLVRHCSVDDCGTILNRVLVDGQIHGGVAQGVGQALFEAVRYDDDANPLSGNLTTYLVPTASTMPPLTVDHTVTPSEENPLGVKGVGEAGTIGATPAVQNAVIDAVAHLGVRHLDMPVTPARVWEALQRR